MKEPVVLITGASRGLGRAMALKFADHQYAVAVNYTKGEDQAQKTVNDIIKAGGKAKVFEADVRHSSQVNKMMKNVHGEWGRIDVLINNAGISRDRTIAKMTDDEWRDVMAVNLDGTFFCSRAVIPYMRKQMNGVIINLSSFIAHHTVKGTSNYSASKSGITALTKSTALEEGTNNIRALALIPGFHVTDMNRKVWEIYQKPILEQHLLKKLPEMSDLAEFVVTMAELKSVTGQVFSYESRLSES